MRDGDPRSEAPHGWRARLALQFALNRGETRLVRREHCGPLVVQKALHPEPGVCQAVVVHPPGGIAGGDRLELDVQVDHDAHAQLITPGAAKWYRSNGPVAHQQVELDVGDGAVLEWLPHESIVFDGAAVSMETTLAVRGKARALAWDVVCLGRAASGERFTHGFVRQRLEVVRDGTLLWIEQSRIDAGSGRLASEAGLGMHPVFGTLVLTAPEIHDAWLHVARSVGSDIAMQDHAITRVPGVLIARCRSDSTARVQAWFRALWRALREPALERASVWPRLWST